MRLARAGWVLLFSLAVVSLAQEASAKLRAPGVPSVPITEMSRTYDPEVDRTAQVCQLGIVAAPFSTQPVLDFDPVDGDYFYTFVNMDSLSCPSCGLGTYGRITAVHLALYFPAAPETAVVSIRLVGVGTYGPTCWFENANDQVCSGFDYTITWQSPAQANEFVIPVPEDCRLEVSGIGRGVAFLEINFKYSSQMQLGMRPELVVGASAVRCYTYVPIDNPLNDWVDLFPGAGNPLMSVDVEQCISVPVLRKSWGQLKQIYR